MECMGYETLDPCETKNMTGDCCLDCINSKKQEPIHEDCYCCCADELKCEMQLCYHTDELQDFYSCNVRYQVVYDCRKGEQFAKDKFTGQKLCIKDICNDSVIAGRFYSETEIPTTDVTIIIDGLMHNPWVTINGNTNIIHGDYEGSLIIKPNGDVYYRTKDGCCETLLDPFVWIVPSGNTYGWAVNPRDNSITVNLNICCSVRSCVYIQHQPITV